MLILALAVSGLLQSSNTVAFAYVARPGEGLPDQKLVEIVAAQGKELRGPMRLATGHYMMADSGQVTVFSPKLHEIKWIDMAERALMDIRGIPSELQFKLSLLGEGSSDLVLEYLNAYFPINAPPSGRLAPETLCRVAYRTQFELSDGTRTISYVRRRDSSPKLSSLSGLESIREERRRLHEEMANGGIWGVDPQSDQAKSILASIEAERAKVGGSVGVNVRLFGPGSRMGREVKDAAALNLYSELLALRRLEVSRIAEPLLKDMAGRFSGTASAKKNTMYADLPKVDRDEIKMYLDSNMVVSGFKSAEEVAAFLSGALLSNATVSGIDISVRLMPSEGYLVVPLWPH
jgi:hypothetical protein